MRLHGLTAPDPRPYAAPTDLVTAEDVARWLRSIPHTGRPWPNECPVCSAMLLLTERLDRERRQACRRGALAEWRRFRRGALVPPLADYETLSDRFSDRSTTTHRARSLTRALAFRAAARAR